MDCFSFYLKKRCDSSHQPDRFICLENPLRGFFVLFCFLMGSCIRLQVLSAQLGQGDLGQVPIVKVLEDTSECSVDGKDGCAYAGLEETSV